MLFVEEICNNNNGYFVGEYKSSRKYNTFYNPHTLVNIIPTIINKSWLIELERKYDVFLEKNKEKLIIQDTIEDYLDIRDAIGLQIMYINRKEMLQMNRKNNIDCNNPYYSPYAICKPLLFPLLTHNLYKKGCK
jgi:hypothetical protein